MTESDHETGAAMPEDRGRFFMNLSKLMSFSFLYELPNIAIVPYDG
ncbi:hypothetical protein BBOR36S_02656 [Brevibacillus borstelensis]|jgi:hypothetical protein